SGGWDGIVNNPYSMRASSFVGSPALRSIPRGRRHAPPGADERGRKFYSVTISGPRSDPATAEPEGARPRALRTPRRWDMPCYFSGGRAVRDGALDGRSDMDTTKKPEETSTPWRPGAHASGEVPGRDAIQSVRDGLDALGNQVRGATEAVQRRMAEFQEH